MKCKYCDGAGPSRGFIWTDNNGPIVACPVCNAEYDTPRARREREYEAAEYQRTVAALSRPQRGSPHD